MSAAGNSRWPVLKRYSQGKLARIALPLGGIGTGTVSLGGRGDLRDWEIMNRPGKGFVPRSARTNPFFALFAKAEGRSAVTLALEGPIELADYEASHGSEASNHGLPRFRGCSFEAAYPLGQVMLNDPDAPLAVRLEAFNPMAPGDAETSGIPIAVLRYVLRNRTARTVAASVCGSMPNFIGVDGWDSRKEWGGNPVPLGAKANRNTFRKGAGIQGIFMESDGVSPGAEQWGTMALATTARSGVTCRTAWLQAGWGSPLLDFWDDFSADGALAERQAGKEDMPMASLAVALKLPPRATRAVTFLLTWRFPNRRTWTPAQRDGECGGDGCCEADMIGNHYAVRYRDAWDVAEKEAPRLEKLERETVDFVRTFCESSLPRAVKEAALFNLSTLRSQSCFRTPDGRFYGWEGCHDRLGCCHGSCTHVWNYEQATAFLYGDLARTMREVEFAHATDSNGLMSFRVNLPLDRARDFGKAAADGQMGCIMKMYRDWQLSGDHALLRSLWPNVKRALEFCWIKGGWDADRDGVMEGCQHNTMDVEYYGPNPQMGIWYLGALRAAEEMALYLGDQDFAATCRDLFERGRQWIDDNLFNGEHYEHRIQPPKSADAVAQGLRVGMGAIDVAKPQYQLGEGCLVDQLVGQFMAHVCGLGYLVKPENVRKTLKSILRHNFREDFHAHFNCLRSFALGGESALLMASYPKGRPAVPFPYFTEVMTGVEYAAAVGMLYEGQVREGLRCIQNIRNRYDGRKRSPFNEAECGHHYARAMASWAAVLALTGFRYSGVDGIMTFAAKQGAFFWSNGYAWGGCSVRLTRRQARIAISVRRGELALSRFVLDGFGQHDFARPIRAGAGGKVEFRVRCTGFAR